MLFWFLLNPIVGDQPDLPTAFDTIALGLVIATAFVICIAIVLFAVKSKRKNRAS